MSAEPNIRERLFDLCIGHGEWHIRKGDGICMTFSHSDSLDPEREAIAWLAEHQERYPERFAGYEVHRVTVQSELQLAALAVLEELDRLRATSAPGAPAGFKLVPIEPTPEMIAAGQEAQNRACYQKPQPVGGEWGAVYYRAMLDAAPGAPGQEAAAVQAVGAMSEQQIWDWWGSENGLEDCNMSKVNDFRQVVRAVEKKLAALPAGAGGETL